MKNREPEPGQRGHWALAVLALLRERPMHPYEMRQLIRQRHKEARLGLKAGSLYHAVGWLERNGLIVAVETSRQGKRPERTIYRLTATGRRELLDWLRALVATPAREPSSFAVALDHLVHLAPTDAADHLERRATLLQAQLKEMDQILETLTPTVGRINLIEVDFERALCRAELAWAQTVVGELRSGVLAWDIEQLLKYLRLAAARPAADV